MSPQQSLLFSQFLNWGAMFFNLFGAYYWYRRSKEAVDIIEEYKKALKDLRK